MIEYLDQVSVSKYDKISVTNTFNILISLRGRRFLGGGLRRVLPSASEASTRAAECERSEREGGREGRKIKRLQENHMFLRLWRPYAGAKS